MPKTEEKQAVKAVIYARYSSDRQREESIEGQLRVCEDYARRNNMTILHTYADRAMTGRSDQRPEFQMMIRDAATMAFDVVLVYKLYLTYTAQDSSGFLIGEDDVAAEIHTQEISLDSFDENGQLRMSFPFANKDAVYVDEETGEVYDNSAWCQIVRVRAYDAAGHVTTCNALLYDTVYGQTGSDTPAAP